MQPSIGRNIGNVVVMHTDYRMHGELRYLEDVILICYYYIIVSLRCASSQSIKVKLPASTVAVGYH